MNFMVAQPVLLRSEFDALPEAEKQRAFTITGLQNIRAISELHEAIRETLTIPEEDLAWAQYLPVADAILRRYQMRSAPVYETLWVSFRMARDNAYNQGVKAYAEQNIDTIHGYIYHTQDDRDVRTNHALMEGAVRSIDDPVWDIWRPPNGFGCRCWLDIVSIADYEVNPEKYEYTDPVPDVKPDKGFRKTV